MQTKRETEFQNLIHIFIFAGTENTKILQNPEVDLLTITLVSLAAHARKYKRTYYGSALLKFTMRTYIGKVNSVFLSVGILQR
jgi:hypothetical protein